METEEQEEVKIPMQPTALEAARVDMKRHDTQRKEEERMEEEREKEETGLNRWVDHDMMLVDKTPGEILLNDTLPVMQERPKLTMTLPVPRVREPENIAATDQLHKGKRQSRNKRRKTDWRKPSW